MYVQDYDERFPSWDPNAAVNNAWAAPNGSGWWMNEIYPYVKNYQIYACPDDTRPDGQNHAWGYAIIPNTNPTKYYVSSYGMSEWLHNVGNGFQKQSAIPYVASTEMLTDAAGPLINDWDNCGGDYPGGFTRTWFANAGEWPPFTPYDTYKDYARHSEGSNVAFVDGHAKYLQNKKFFETKLNGSVCPDGGNPKAENPLGWPMNLPQ